MGTLARGGGMHPARLGARRVASPRGRLTLAVAAVVAAVAGSLVLPSTPAVAQQTRDRPVTVTAGYDGFYVPGRPFPLRVRVAGERLIKGTVEVRVTAVGGTTTLRLPVEVPGGGAKSYVVTAPAGARRGRQVSVQLRQGDTRVGESVDAALRSEPDVELVGLLPGVLAGDDLPGAAPLAVDAGTARFHELDEALLGQAPASLGPLGTIGAADGELARLPERTRSALLRWVAGGGRLLVDATSGPVGGLPDEWQPVGSATRAAAGRGEIVLTAGAMAGGRWANLVEPTGIAVSSPFDGFGGGLGLAGEAGVRVPQLGWLLLFLLAYVVLVGPITFIVLRRRGRAELAWLVVPMLAVVFTTGAYAAGRSLRSRTNAAYASIVELDSAAGDTVLTYVGLSSPSGGDPEVELPPGWSAAGTEQGGSITVDVGGSSSVAKLGLETGEFGVVATEGPLDVDAGLVVEGTAEGGRAEGTVRNTSDRALHEVEVWLDTSRISVGTLAPGAESTWTSEQGRRQNLDEELFGRFDGGPSRESGGNRNGSVWAAYVSSRGPNLRPPGSVVAVGWTRELELPVDVKGRARAKGTTALVAHAPLEAAGGAPGSRSVRRTTVRGFSDEGGPRNVDRTVVRFALPAGASTTAGDYVLRTNGAPMEVWANGSWRSLGGDVGRRNGPIVIGPGQVDPDQDAFGRAPLPEGAIQNGIVWVRTPFFGDFTDSGIVLEQA